MRTPRSRPPPRRPRALLAAEIDGRHPQRDLLAAVAGALRARGFECLAAVPDTRLEEAFLPHGVRTVQTVRWPGGLARDHRPVLGLTDLLANLGLVDPRTLAGAIGHYEALFGLFSPDVVVCDGAFAALLAARGRIPAVACGSARWLPPVLDGRPVPFGGPDAVSAWSFAEVLDAVNVGLDQAGRLPLGELGEILGGAAAILPSGPDVLDPYAAWRSHACLPVQATGVAADPDAAPVGVDVELGEGLADAPQMVAGLLAVGRLMRVRLPKALRRERHLLAQAGVALADDGDAPLPGRADVIVHAGEPPQVAAWLAAGTPQVILAEEADGRAAGAYLAGLGLGAWQDLTLASAGWLVAEVQRCREADRRAACEAFAPTARTWFGADPAEMIAAAAATAASRGG